MDSKSLDSIELERNELVRLLSTAKDDDRREMLQRSIAALDERKELLISSNDSFGKGGGGGGGSLVPGLSSSAMRKVGSGNDKGMLRPLSARSRSSSQSNLEIIHENNSVDSRIKRMPTLPLEEVVFERLSEEELGVAQRICLDHVSTIIASSHDPACAVSKLLPARFDDNLPKEAFWVSTGMFPQQISIVLKEKWIIRQVELRAKGVSCMSIRFGVDPHPTVATSSIAASSDSVYGPRRRTVPGTAMTSDRGGNFLFNDQSNNADAGVTKPKPVDRIVITVVTASELFVQLGCISVMAEPSSRGLRAP